MPRLSVVAAVSGVLGAAAKTAQSDSVTPVEKVVDLLTKLSTQIEEEGKKEAAEYDKFACFCKEQADNKQYAIEKSEEKIGVLDAKVTQLSADIDALNADVQKLGEEITDLEGKIDTASTEREGEHATYKGNAADMKGAIDAVTRAIEAMEQSKDAMVGKADVDALLQKAKALAAKAMHGKQEPAEFTYQSNDIIATLESLKETFTRNLNELETSEFESNSAFERRRLGWQNEKKFAAEEKTSKEMQADTKTAEKSKTEEEKTLETAAKDADNNYLGEVKTECEEKAGIFDQRSKTRSSELTAIAEAKEALKTGVAPNWGANKKLANLEKHSQVRKAAAVVSTTQAPKHTEAAKKTSGDKKATQKKPLSFLQVRGNKGTQEAALQKGLEFLSEASDRLGGSPILAAAMVKVKVSEDHFVKVRTLIKDIIQRLEDQASAEATHKGYCDENMKTQVTARDEAKGNLEGYETEISAKTAEQTKLKAEVVTLSQQIAENEKAINEATELRTAESAENKKVIADATVGKENVQLALDLLSKFYAAQGGEALLQAMYEPPNADREGKTFSDRAPGVFQDEYKGRQSESKGIIGLLEIILADFERTSDTTETQEAEAEEKHSDFVTQTNEDTAAKKKDIDEKEGTLETLADDLVTLEDQKKDATKALALAEEELSQLETMCVAGKETYEDKVAKRKKEIEALKQALEIFENWKN
eukprot:TRINITY_DN80187_c0_g1_i1.p1 TRINITY_DN80187_c0_g1~~TRINITY_DN80187_c0_g1_i1.p1  ORF type:complete len:707 (-),score=362.58 TRINITY_DN80187_c0_g1_i1:67-2187(-)